MSPGTTLGSGDTGAMEYSKSSTCSEKLISLRFRAALCPCLPNPGLLWTASPQPEPQLAETIRPSISQMSEDALLWVAGNAPECFALNLLSAIVE